MHDDSGLTPYDTGERCEPRPWHPDRQSVLEAARHEHERRNIGKVDFDDDEAHTVVTVHVARDDDGTHTVHVEPFTEEDAIEVRLHGERRTAVAKLAAAK